MSEAFELLPDRIRTGEFLDDLARHLGLQTRGDLQQLLAGEIIDLEEQTGRRHTAEDHLLHNEEVLRCIAGQKGLSQPYRDQALGMLQALLMGPVAAHWGQMERRNGEAT